MKQSATQFNQAQQHNTPPAALTEKDAARYIGMSVPFLRQSRCHGNRNNHTPAPNFVKAGRAVRYRIVDLDRWLEENCVDLYKTAEI